MFVCKDCGRESFVWKRFCPECNAELSLKKKPSSLDVDITEKSTCHDLIHLPSGFPFFDQVFNGGFFQTFLYFIHAERGAGKTTFLLQACSFLVSLGKAVVFFSFDESAEGITKKCLQYNLGSNKPHFICENSPGIVEKTIAELRPDFVVLDSLQSFAMYNNDKIVKTLYRIRNIAKKRRFALVIIGEERKDRNDYLGSTSIGHIIDVLIKFEHGLNNEVIISTPNKNRDTDDRTSRCFFRRTSVGLVEIQECETGYLHRHSEKEIIGLISFVAKKGDDFFVDEITAAIVDRDVKKVSLTIAGMSQAKAKNLLAVINNAITLIDVELILRANNTEKLYYDAELACVLAVFSVLMKKPVPVDTIFIGGIDNRGYLLPIDGMEGRVKRAKALGYKRIIGPKAIGSQTAIWEEFDTLESIKREFFI